MPIEFACESCAKLLRVPDGSGGAQCQCPACQAIVDIPDPDAIGMVEFERATSSGRPAQKRLRIACPKCSAVLQCARELIGTKGQCKSCNNIFLIALAAEGAHAQVAANDQSAEIFECPKCGQLFEGGQDMQGKKGKCHVCGEVFVIQLRCQADERKQEEAASLEIPVTEHTARDDSRGASTTDKVPSESNVASAPSRKQARPKQSDTPTRNAKSERASEPFTSSDQKFSQDSCSIRIGCPNCQGVMEVPASAAGKQAACPFCQQLLQIPDSLSVAEHDRSSESTGSQSQDRHWLANRHFRR